MRAAPAVNMSASIRLRRRTFLGVAGAVALSACKSKGAPSDAPKEGAMALPPPNASTMPRRALGKTGVEVSLVGLGGYHVGNVKDDAEAVRMVQTAIDRGLNHPHRFGIV
ncbi:MAG TPA: hypothetical protein VM925_36910, partial [Labilithrix sp.]|nr:hypothetical protein [Labilithrix sp.]